MKKLIFLPPGDPLADKYRMLIGGALVIYLVFSTLIDTVTERGEHPLPTRSRAIVRLTSATAVTLLTWMGGGWPATLWVSLVALACITPIIVDLVVDRRQRRALT